MPARKSTSGASQKADGGFTVEERAAMRERARELRAARSRGGDANDEAAVLARIAEMPPDDRALAEQVHAIVRSIAPTLVPRLWYGMPAYAKDGKVLCFFQDAKKFKSRYATLGFSDQATLDRGDMWPTSYALRAVGAAEARMIGDLLRRAMQDVVR